MVWAERGEAREENVVWGLQAGGGEGEDVFGGEGGEGGDEVD